MNTIGILLVFLEKAYNSTPNCTCYMCDTHAFQRVKSARWHKHGYHLPERMQSTVSLGR